MGALIQLLGSPTIEIDGSPRAFRSRKSWAVLSYVLLSERPRSRAHLAALLFGSADDPRRALRWSLSEIRSGIGESGSLNGDPLFLDLSSDVEVDVDLVLRGTWRDAMELRGLGAELLEGMAFDGCPAFEAWLLAERRRMASASEGILHEAALSLLVSGDYRPAVSAASRAVEMNPLDEDHQALLIRSYVHDGDRESAKRQAAAYTALLATEMGVAPGPAIASALRAARRAPNEPDVDPVTVRAMIEAGVAAVDAGATESGVESLRLAVRSAEAVGQAPLLVESKVALAEALIHSLRGEDEEGTTLLHSAVSIAESAGMNLAAGRAMSTVGYVDFLRGRYHRAEQWFVRALSVAPDDRDLTAKVYTFLGSVESDRANYGRALELLEAAADMSNAPRDARRLAYSLAMHGRVHLLRGDGSRARRSLEESIRVAEGARWLAFLPWPRSLQGELEVIEGDAEAGNEILERAFAAACQLGDPCWEGAAARGLALFFDAIGDVERAFEILADAQARCNRLSDTYVWLDAYILDSLATLGVREGHPEAGDWALALSARAERSAMRELAVRAMLHRLQLGEDQLASAAVLQGREIDNPRLSLLLPDIQEPA